MRTMREKRMSPFEVMCGIIIVSVIAVVISPVTAVVISRFFGDASKAPEKQAVSTTVAKPIAKPVAVETVTTEVVTIENPLVAEVLEKQEKEEVESNVTERALNQFGLTLSNTVSVSAKK